MKDDDAARSSDRRGFFVSGHRLPSLPVVDASPDTLSRAMMPSERWRR